MFKTIWLMKRKPGMSREDFIAYYETRHRLIGEKVLGGAATHYVRRFLHPIGADTPEPVYDVVMELWFQDRETYEKRMQDIWNDRTTAEMIAADEANFFDRTSMVHYAVEEHFSEMPGIATRT